MGKHVFRVSDRGKTNQAAQSEKPAEGAKVFTVKFLNFRMQENFAVIYLKFKQKAQTLWYLVEMMPMK